MQILYAYKKPKLPVRRFVIKLPKTHSWLIVSCGLELRKSE